MSPMPAAKVANGSSAQGQAAERRSDDVEQWAQFDDLGPVFRLGPGRAAQEAKTTAWPHPSGRHLGDQVLRLLIVGVLPIERVAAGLRGPTGIEDQGGAIRPRR